MMDSTHSGTNHQFTQRYSDLRSQRIHTFMGMTYAVRKKMVSHFTRKQRSNTLEHIISNYNVCFSLQNVPCKIIIFGKTT